MTDPLRPFGDPRSILEPRLSALADGDAAAARAVSLSYRISGGPPGKLLNAYLQIYGTGEATYHREDELAHGRPVHRRVRLAPDDVLGLFRQVRASGLLEQVETGGGFLPGSVIGSITLEAPDAGFSYHFLVDDAQRAAQGKELAQPLRALKPLLDGLMQNVRDAKRQRSRRKGG
jgi:hypothetical protein